MPAGDLLLSAVGRHVDQAGGVFRAHPDDLDDIGLTDLIPVQHGEGYGVEVLEVPVALLEEGPHGLGAIARRGDRHVQFVHPALLG
jgi:hypothetical protein